MICYDFIYDGIRISDKGYMMCDFNGGGFDTISNGSQLTFTMIPILSGEKQILLSSKYDATVSAVFHICKNPCAFEDMEMNLTDVRFLTRWLNRKQLHPLTLLTREYGNLNFNASFNVSRFDFGGRIIGLELTMTTDRPFALRDQDVILIDNSERDDVFTVFSQSDEEGFIYPDTEIKVLTDGDLEIVNNYEDRTTVIKNCTLDETINLKYPLIWSDNPEHQIQNDFNWEFFRLCNTFSDEGNPGNVLHINIPCTISLTYSPIIKLGA